jgi:LytS/YehU family sensor histidine kinase
MLEVAGLMRPNIRQFYLQTITIADEIKYLETYYWNNKRFDNRIQFTIEVDENIDESNRNTN